MNFTFHYKGQRRIIKIAYIGEEWGFLVFVFVLAVVVVLLRLLS